MEQSLNIETVNKHFQEVPNQTFTPGKIDETKSFDKEYFTANVRKFWATHGHKYQESYQTGRLIATESNNINLQTVLLQLAKIVEEGVKVANTKAELTSESLKEHFIMLTATLKVLAVDITNASKEPFDTNELLAILAGFVEAKIYNS